MIFHTLFLIGFSLSIVNCQTTFPCNVSAPCGCSRSPAVISRIMGGETAVNGSWGWAVSISLNDSYFCGGVLISQSWVLSTASCIWDYRAADIYVSAATNVFWGWKQWRSVISVIRHPDFSTYTWVNDLILLRLSSPFNMTDSAIARVCLPPETTEDYPPVNSSVDDVV